MTETSARRDVRWLLENRTQIGVDNVTRLLKRYDIETLRRDVRTAIAAVLENEHYDLQYSREVTRLSRDVADRLFETKESDA